MRKPGKIIYFSNAFAIAIYLYTASKFIALQAKSRSENMRFRKIKFSFVLHEKKIKKHAKTKKKLTLVKKPKQQNANNLARSSFELT